MPSRWTIGRCRTKCYSCHAHAGMCVHIEKFRSHTNFLCRGSFRCPLHHFRRGRSLRYPVQMALLMDSANKTLDSTRSYKNISYERKCYCGKYTECDWLCWKKVTRAAIASFRQIWNISCGEIFCADCSEFWAPLPNERLFNPVRLCGSCYTTVTTNVLEYPTVPSESQMKGEATTSANS
ncbi:uncharacterized protein LOC108047158 isoform X1 [Drosophila rhopaloa]|uniref:FYVE zinc finger domain-containing protein n=1 Tax=Drosophila rhopaloa TaxID=1041015 RepID=A0ABM5J8E1_DRORH|nr:uncharacterized protein LOC108047158 isoform X1 [Drosophila rhopaloa]